MEQTHRQELQDLIWQALDNSMGPDWNTMLGARYVVDALGPVYLAAPALLEDVQRLVGLLEGYELAGGPNGYVARAKATIAAATVQP